MCVCVHALHEHTPSLLPPPLQRPRQGPESRPCHSPCAPSVSGLNNGDLLLKDISSEDNGLYQCTVANHVGYSVCVVEVKVSGRCGGSAPGGPGTQRARLEEAGLYLQPPGLCSPPPQGLRLS